MEDRVREGGKEGERKTCTREMKGGGKSEREGGGKRSEKEEGGVRGREEEGGVRRRKEE